MPLPQLLVPGRASQHRHTQFSKSPETGILDMMMLCKKKSPITSPANQIWQKQCLLMVPGTASKGYMNCIDKSRGGGQSINWERGRERFTFQLTSSSACLDIFISICRLMRCLNIKLSYTLSSGDVGSLIGVSDYFACWHWVAWLGNV